MDEEQVPDRVAAKVAEILASTHFGRELAAEGHPVVALDDHGNIVEYTSADMGGNGPGAVVSDDEEVP